jgi:phosphate transport system substrate-binding protein
MTLSHIPSVVSTLLLLLATQTVFIAGARAAGDADVSLRIHGSNTVGEHLAPALIDGWLRARDRSASMSDVAGNERRWQSPDVAIELQAHGSNTGLRDLIAGRADIAMSSRPVFPADIDAGVRAGLGRLDVAGQEFVIALDGLAIIVHPDNPVAQLDIDAIRRLFAGDITNWRQVGGGDSPVAIAARDDQSGTYETFRMLVLGEKTLASRARRFESTDALSAYVASDPTAIGFVGLGGIGAAKPVAIRDADTPALLPDAGVVAVEDYLLTRRLYLYLRNDADRTARDFAAFAISDAAQPLVERAGFVGQAIRSVSADPPGSAPGDYRELVRDSLRLSLNFRFGTGATLLDSRAIRDLDRLATFLRQPDQSGARVLLLGFADASEVLPYLAMTLSNDRVDYVASQLAARGVPVMAARGIGGALPIASNRTEWGRQKNRRVEVWLRRTAIR